MSRIMGRTIGRIIELTRDVRQQPEPVLRQELVRVEAEVALNEARLLKVSTDTEAGLEMMKLLCEESFALTTKRVILLEELLARRREAEEEEEESHE